eukprot:433099-Heterocapsa_arctica.AAC.1
MFEDLQNKECKDPRQKRQGSRGQMAECEGQRRHRRKHHGSGIHLAKHRIVQQRVAGHHGA